MKTFFSHLMAWLPALFCLTAGLLIGVGVFTFHYANGTAYFSNDPRACINCHVMQENYDSWLKSSHHAVASCNDCHVPHDLSKKYLIKALNGWNHSRAFTLQNFKEPIRITELNRRVAESSCLHCHDVLLSQIAPHHQAPGAEINCTKCHRSVGHMEL